MKTCQIRSLRPGQALVKLHAIGVNFIDVYHRTGLYKLPCRLLPAWKAPGLWKRWEQMSPKCNLATVSLTPWRWAPMRNGPSFLPGSS